MEIKFTPLNVILVVCIVQGIIMGVRIFFKKEGNPTANRFLGLFVACISLELTHLFFTLADIFAQNPDLYMMPIYSSFAFGALLYWYVRSLTRPQDPFNFRKHGRHFIPFFVQFVFYCVLANLSYDNKNWFWQNFHSLYTYPFETHFRYILFFIYLFFSVKLVLEYQKSIRENYSDVEKITLRWLYRLLVVMGVVFLIDWIEAPVHNFFNWHPFHFGTWLPAVTVYWLGWTITMGKSGAPAPTAIVENEHLTDIETTPQAASSAPLLGDSELQRLAKDLRGKMEEEQWYLNPTLKLNDLAEELSLPVKTLSYVINTGIGKSFYEFVNGYRVEEVQKRLNDSTYSHLSLLGIAFESGFNSKATFNRIFKKFTGESPSAFQKRLA